MEEVGRKVISGFLTRELFFTVFKVYDSRPCRA